MAAKGKRAAESAKQADWRPLPSSTFFRSSAQRARKQQFWWQRAAKWQLWGLGLAGVGVCGLWATHPIPTTVGVGIVAGLWVRVYMTRRERRLRREHVWEMVQPHLGLPAGLYPEAREWVTIPRDPAAKDAEVRIELPAGWSPSPERKEGIRSAVAGALPGTWEATWHVKYSDTETSWFKRKVLGAENHDSPHVTFSHPPEPPDLVRFTDPDVRDRFEEGPEHLIPLGKDNRGNWVDVNIAGESPHIAYSGGTGAGKSTTLRGIIAYLIYHGTKSVDIIDPKRVSLTRPFKGVPGVRIHKDVTRQRNAVEAFYSEMIRRYEWAETQDDEEEALESLEPQLLVIEEGGSFWDMVRAEYALEKQKGDPAEPPTVTAYRHILFQGRQAKMRILLVVQQGNARDMGGSAARDQFAAKIMVRFSHQVWQMLVGTRPAPDAPSHEGRGYVVRGDQRKKTQLVFATSEEAREFALSAPWMNATGKESEEENSVIVPDDGDIPESRDHLRLVRDTVQDTPETAPPAQTSDPSPTWVSKAEIMARLEMTESAFDKWRQRATKDGHDVPKGTKIKNRLHWTEDEADRMEMIRRNIA